MTSPKRATISLETSAGGATTAKVYEYLAARKPIFAVTESEGVAAELLREAGEHTIAEPAEVEIARGDLRDAQAAPSPSLCATAFWTMRASTRSG